MPRSTDAATTDGERPSGLESGMRWEDSWIDSTWPLEQSAQPVGPAPSAPPAPLRPRSVSPTVQNLETRHSSPAEVRPSRRLLMVGLVAAGALALAAIVAAVTLPSGRGEAVALQPAGSALSIDRVFASVDGYRLDDSRAAAVAALRSQLEGQPSLKAITIDVGGRQVTQRGDTVAVASAVVFHEEVGASSDPADVFLTAAQGDLTAHEQLTLAGQRAVLGQEPDGIQVVVVYKSRVGLIVGGTDRVVLEDLTTKLLNNIP